MQAALRRYRIPPHATFRPPPSPPPLSLPPPFSLLSLSFILLFFFLFPPLLPPRPPPSPSGDVRVLSPPKERDAETGGCPPSLRRLCAERGHIRAWGGGSLPPVRPETKFWGSAASASPPLPPPSHGVPGATRCGTRGGSRAEPRRGGAALLSGRVGPRAARCCNRVFFSASREEGGRWIELCHVADKFPLASSPCASPSASPLHARGFFF